MRVGLAAVVAVVVLVRVAVIVAADAKRHTPKESHVAGGHGRAVVLARESW